MEDYEQQRRDSNPYWIVVTRWEVRSRTLAHPQVAGPPFRAGGGGSTLLSAERGRKIVQRYEEEAVGVLRASRQQHCFVSVSDRVLERFGLLVAVQDRRLRGERK